jgi:predicted dehydrogenase
VVHERSGPVAVGLIGYGRIARLFHAKILRELGETELTAIAEIDDERRREAQRLAPGIDVIRDYAALLERSDVEAVVLCLPTGMHADTAIAAFQHGKHVYLEKPLAASLDEGRRVIEAWRESGTIGAIGFNTRLNPLYRQARRLLSEGILGELVAVQGVFASATRELPAWKRSRSTGGGVLLDLASHQVDRVEYLLEDRVAEVATSVRSVRTESDTAILTLKLASGLPVQLLVANNALDEDRLELYGTKGKLVLDRFRSRRLQLVSAEYPGRVQALVRGLHEGATRARDTLFRPTDPSFRDALRAFALAVRGRGSVAADLADGYRSLAVVVAAEASAVNGGPVRPSPAE